MLRAYFQLLRTLTPLVAVFVHLSAMTLLNLPLFVNLQFSRASRATQPTRKWAKRQAPKHQASPPPSFDLPLRHRPCMQARAPALKRQFSTYADKRSPHRLRNFTYHPPVFKRPISTANTTPLAHKHLAAAKSSEAPYSPAPHPYCTQLQARC